MGNPKSGTARHLLVGMRTAWILLVLAGFLEAGWAYSMKLSNGFTRIWPSAITLVSMVASFVLLARSLETLPLGTAYVVWTGIGAVGAFLIGILAFNEHVGFLRISGALLVISGLALIKYSSPD